LLYQEECLISLYQVINKAPSSSLPVNVGQVWAEPR